MGSEGCSFSGTLIPSVKLAKSTSRIDMNASLNANAKMSLRGFTIRPYQVGLVWVSNGIKLVEPISTRIKL
jgi:hypothetical protein